MSHYINPAVITEKIVQDFIDRGDNLERYFDRMDKAFVSLALRRGIYSTSTIKLNSDNHVSDQTCQDWCSAWVCMNVCLDNIGRNNLEVSADDKYAIKYEMYKALLADFDRKITANTITGDADERIDMTSSAYGMRG